MNQFKNKQGEFMKVLRIVLFAAMAISTVTAFSQDQTHAKLAGVNLRCHHEYQLLDANNIAIEKVRSNGYETYTSDKNAEIQFNVKDISVKIRLLPWACNPSATCPLFSPNVEVTKDETRIDFGDTGIGTRVWFGREFFYIRCLRADDNN